MTLGEVLSDQIQYSDLLGRDPSFKRSMLQDQFIDTIFNILVPYIVHLKMEVIISSSRLILTNNNINHAILYEFTFKSFDTLQQISTLFLSSLHKTAGGIKD